MLSLKKPVLIVPSPFLIMLRFIYLSWPCYKETEIRLALQSLFKSSPATTLVFTVYSPSCLKSLSSFVCVRMSTSYTASLVLACLALAAALVIFISSVRDAFKPTRRWERPMILFIWIALVAGLIAFLALRDVISWQPVKLVQAMLILITRCPFCYKVMRTSLPVI